MARRIRRFAHGRRVDLAAVQPGRDQTRRVGRADRQVGGGPDYPRGYSAGARLPGDAGSCRGVYLRRRFDRRYQHRVLLSQCCVCAVSGDAARWPRTAAFVARVLNLESFAKLKSIEDRLIRTPLAHHRDALIEMGAPLMKTTCGTEQ